MKITKFGYLNIRGRTFANLTRHMESQHPEFTEA